MTMTTLRLAKPVQARVTRNDETIETEIREMPIREPTFADLIACGDLYTTITRPDRTMTVERRLDVLRSYAVRLTGYGEAVLTQLSARDTNRLFETIERAVTDAAGPDVEPADAVKN